MKITVTGRRAPDDMPPAEYLARCTRAEIKRRGRNHMVVLNFSILEPANYGGVVLLSWFAITENLSPVSKYAKAWEKAAGKCVLAGKDLSPEIFVNKNFVVRAGFRTNDNEADLALCSAQRNTFLHLGRARMLLATRRERSHAKRCLS